MATITTKNGTVQVDNITVQWQERVEEGSGDNGGNYTPINPREHATGITYNENELKLSKYTGYNTYETPWRASEFKRNDITYIAIGRKIYTYNHNSGAFALISDFSDILEDDYFVSVGIYDTSDSSDINCFLTHNGMGYVASGSQWGTSAINGHWINFREMIEVDDTTEFTGIATYTVPSSTVQRVVISTTQGLYFCNNANQCQGTYYTGTISGIATDASYAHVFVGNYGGVDSVIAILNEPTDIVGVYRYLTTSGTSTTGGFAATSAAINNKFHGYKNAIPALNMVIFNDGIWICENYTATQLNTSDLVRLTDTQYINYVKEWVSSTSTSVTRYSVGNSKWCTVVQYNYQGGFRTAARYTNLSPIYTLVPTIDDSEYCVQIMNDGAVMRLNSSISGTRIGNSGTVELYNNQRAPKFSYDIDIGTENGTVQESIETLNNSLIPDGKIFELESNNIPYSMGTSDNIYDSSWGIKAYDVTVSPNKQYGFVYDTITGNIDILHMDGGSEVWTKYNMISGSDISCGSYAVWDNNNTVWTVCRRYQNNAAFAVLKRLNPANGTISRYELSTSFNTDMGDNLYKSLYFTTNGTLFYLGVPVGDIYAFYRGSLTDVINTGDSTLTPYFTSVNYPDSEEYNTVWFMGNVYNDSNETGTTDIIMYALCMNDNLWELLVFRSNGFYQVSVFQMSGSVVPDKGYNSRLLRYGRYDGEEVVAFYSPSEMFCYASWSAIATGTTYTYFGTETSAFIGDNTRVRGLSYLGNSQWVVFGTEVDNPTRTRYAISNNTSWTAGLSLTLYTQKAVNNPIQAGNIASSMFYISNNGTVQLLITTNDGCIGTLSKTTTQLSCGTLTQTYYANNPFIWQKVIFAQGRHIGLVNTNYNATSPQNTVLCRNQSYVIYSDDGMNWYGGYELLGSVGFDIIYNAGILNVAIYRYLSSDTSVGNYYPIVVSSCNNNANAELTFNTADIWQIIYSNTGTTTPVSTTAQTYYISVDATANSFVGSFSIGTNGGSKILGCVIDTIYGRDIITTVFNISGFSDKVVAVGDGHYCYLRNLQGTMTVRDIYIQGAEEITASEPLQVDYTDSLRATLSGTDTSYATRISEYDPFYNGIYIVTSTYVLMYTAFPTDSTTVLMNLGNNSNTSANKGMVKYCHGRFIYNKSSAPMYGIVPFFNVNPTDEKSLTTITDNGGTSIYRCTYYNDIIFVVDNQGKLYTSKTI